MLGEAAKLQGVQLLGDLLRPATVDKLPQLKWSPVQKNAHTYFNNCIAILTLWSRSESYLEAFCLFRYVSSVLLVFSLPIGYTKDIICLCLAELTHIEFICIPRCYIVSCIALTHCFSHYSGLTRYLMSSNKIHMDHELFHQMWLVIWSRCVLAGAYRQCGHCALCSVSHRCYTGEISA